MSETKPREPLVLSPLEDEPASKNPPEPVLLTPEQLAVQAEAAERDRQRQREWIWCRGLPPNGWRISSTERS
jgi:hypothetical protein